MRYDRNNFNFSVKNFLNNEIFTSNKRVINHISLYDYIENFNKVYEKDTESLFFMAGYYVNQSVIESFCDCLKVLSSKSFDNTYMQKENKFGFNFQIRSKNELNYLKFICTINDKLTNNLIRMERKFKIKDYFRFFYILFDSGGKSVSKTNRVFTVSTHSPIRGYSIHNGSIYNNKKKNLNLHLSSLYSISENRIKYELSHMLHFRKDLNFLLKKIIFPSLIGFDLNYFDIFK